MGPTGEVKGPVQVFATFDKAVTRLGALDDGRAAGFLKVEPAIPGATRFLGTQTVVFEPAGKVPRSTAFRAVVPVTARGVDGSGPVEETSVSFSTPRLALLHAHPGAGFAQAAADQSFSLRFNQPVTPAEVQALGSFQPEGEGAAKVPATCVAGDKDGPENTCVCKPAQPLPVGAKVVLVVAKELHGAEGALTMAEPIRLPFKVHGPLSAERVTCEEKCFPDMGARVEFTTPVVPQEARPFVEVSPALTTEHGTGTYPTTTYYLSGLKPSTAYSVRLKAGLPDRFGQKLAQDKVLNFVTSSARPAAHVSGGYLTMEPGRTWLPARGTNAGEAQVSLWRVTPEEAPALAMHLGGRGSDRKVRAPDAKTTFSLRGDTDKQVETKLDLSPGLANGRGLVAYRVQFPGVVAWGNRALSVDGFAQVTSLAVTMKTWPAGTLVWVTELGTGKPVAGAAVSLAGESGPAVWSGTTNEQGLAQGPGSAALGPSHDAMWAVVRKDDDLALGSSAFDDGLAPWDLGARSTWAGDAGEATGLLFTDRGVYRPGETMHVKSVFRVLKDGELSVPATSTGTLVITGPTGDEYARKSVKFTPHGTTHLSVPLDAGARLGSYAISLSAGDESLSLYANVLVEQFKAPDFKVEVTPSRAEAVKGELVSAKGTTLYLFGAPLAGAQSSYVVSRSPASFSPPGPEGFSFGDETRWMETEVMEAAQVGSGTATTATDGSVNFSATMGAPVMKGPERNFFEVTTVDPSGQSVTGRASTLVHPAAHYLGLRLAGSMVRAGAEAVVEVVALQPDGKPAPGAAAKARLLRRAWKAVKQQGLGESHETLQTYEDTEVGACDLTGLGKDPKPCALTPREPGLHVVSVEGQDGKRNPVRTASVLWVFGPGQAPWSTDDTLRVNLVADKKSYRPGETARVLVQNPFPEAEALVTVERGSVMTRWVAHVTGSAPTFEIPVEEAHVPNVFVGVVLLRGRRGAVGGPDADRPAVRGGYVELPVEVASRRVTVTLAPDAAEHGPRDKVTVKVGLQDHAGKPLAGEVTLLAVDEAVLQLTDYKTPDPVSALYAPRGLSVRTADTRVHLVSARSYGEKGETEGGGGLGGILGPDAVRGRFLTCAYFNPSLQVPASGTAEVTFELPDNLTSFRLMAVAVSAENRFGAAQGEVKVKKPLMLRASSPRVMRVGDVASLGVVVVNGSGREGTVEVRAENASPGVVNLASGNATAASAPGSSVPVRFAVTATGTGMATLRFAARLGDHTDGLEVRFPVGLTLPLVHDATYGSVKGGAGESVPLSVPADAHPDHGGLTLTFSPSVLSELAGTAVQLRTYPYECLEQTASRVLPIVEMGALKAAFEPSLGSDQALTQAADAGVQRILAFQNDDGGFGFWSGATSNPWLTSWATLTLDRARQAGFRVPAASVSRAVAFLKEALKQARPDGTPVLDDETQALVVDVLASLNDPAPAFLSRLFDKRDKLSLEARALLAHAAGVSAGATAMRVPLTEDLLGHVHQSPGGATVQDQGRHGWLGSPVRTHALVLRALVALEPRHAHVEKLASGLLAARVKGRYRTTQEAGWALLALRDYQQAREAEKVDLKATATLAGKPLAEASFAQRTLDVVVNTFPLASARGGTLEVKAGGTGTLRYGAALSYAPGKLPAEPLERGLFVQRTLAGADGKPVAAQAPHGVLLRLLVEVATPMDRHHVAVDVPVPAGLELVNARFANAETVPPLDAPSPAPPAEGSEGEGYADAPPVNPLLQGPFDHVELKDDRLLLFAGTLPRGVHRYLVGVRSVTPGAFAFSPARAEEMYAPEVFGMTPGTTLTVLPPPAK
jgi:hypothetical protein